MYLFTFIILLLFSHPHLLHDATLGTRSADELRRAHTHVVYRRGAEGHCMVPAVPGAQHRKMAWVNDFRNLSNHLLPISEGLAMYRFAWIFTPPPIKIIRT